MYDITIPEDELLKKMATPQMSNFVKVSSKDDPTKFCIVPQKFVDQDLERIKKMEVFEDDVWVVTFPKCGTTWTQEMVWMIGHNLDYETGLSIPQDDRFPFLELSGIATHYPTDTFEQGKNQPRPRYIKSHLPIFLLPDQLWSVNPKIIYTARNPKDTAISWFHHHTNLHGYNGTKADFIEAFAKDLVPYSPMNDHVIDFWNLRNKPNILFLFFEDMKRNLEQEVKKVIKFMEKEYLQDEIDKLCVHLSFDSIKNNKTVNKEEIIKQVMEMTGREYNPEKFTFIRKGKVGGYKQELTKEQNEMMDEYIKKLNLKLNINFDMSL